MKLMIATMATALALTPLLVADDDPAELRDEASAVFSEITATPNKGIPRDLDRPSWQREGIDRLLVAQHRELKTVGRIRTFP